KIAVAGAAAAVLLLMLGGGAWWALTPAPKVEAARPRLESGVRLQSALAPPPSEEDAPAAAKGKGKGKGGEAGGGGLNVLVAPQSVGAMLVVPAVNQDAFARIPDRPADPPLVPAPDTALVEQGSDGPLPKVGRDGRRAWQVYARPGPAADDTRPRIAIIIGRLGLSRPGGIESIRRLPGAVTLAFDPTAKSLADWISRARQSGHEVLFMLPVRSVKFPLVDEGPVALQASVPPADNIKRMEQALMRGAGYVGVVTTPEGDLATQEQSLRPVMEGLHKRGLMIVDGGGTPNTLVPRVATALGQPAAVVDVMIDAEPSRAGIEAKLAELETIARTGKAAVGFAQALPVTLDRLIAWIPTLEGKGIVLVPVSAVAGRQVR
ncbi:MAG: divergent polysaccharide deacetylase family protein, partial [Pseudomonadota bacterium]